MHPASRKQWSAACSRAFGGALLLALGMIAGCAKPPGENVEEKRSYIRRAQVRILEETYLRRPDAQALVRSSAGYATFSPFDAKIVVLGGGLAYGLAVDRRSGQRTFMRMTKLEAGVGLGLQEADVLLVFADAERYAAFVAGRIEWGGGASAAAAGGKSGASAGAQSSMSGDPVVIRLSRSGAELGAGIGGYRFTPDPELN